MFLCGAFEIAFSEGNLLRKKKKTNMAVLLCITT